MLIEQSDNNFVTLVVRTATPIWLASPPCHSLASLECQSKEDDAKQMDNLHFFQSPVMMRAFIREWFSQKFKCLKFGFWGLFVIWIKDSLVLDWLISRKFREICETREFRNIAGSVLRNFARCEISISSSWSPNMLQNWKKACFSDVSFKHNKKSSIILEGHATSHEIEGHTTLPTCVYLLELKWKGLFQNF